MNFAPIDYSLDNMDPGLAALRGYGGGLDVQAKRQALDMNASREARAQELHPLAVEGAEQGLAINASREDRAAAAFAQQQEAAQAQQQRQQEFQAAMGGLAQKGSTATIDDFMAVSTKFPQLSKGLMETWDTLDDSRKAGQIGVLSRIAHAMKSGNTETAIEIAKGYAEAARGSGDEQAAATAEGMAQLAEVSPEAALASLGTALTILDPKVAERVFPSSKERVVREVQDFKDGTSVTYFSDGGREVRNPAGEAVEGADAKRLIEQANAFETEQQGDRAFERTAGTDRADVETGSPAEAAKGFGRKQPELVSKAWEGAALIDKNLANIRTAIGALDDGAKAGPVYSRLPKFDEESARLQNALDKMGLDVIGSVTFGALSAGELKLAMETAAPRNLDEEELRKWLVARLDAQTKLRAALLEQAQFLSDPNNTLNDWANQIGAESPKDAEDDGDYSEFLK